MYHLASRRMRPGRPAFFWALPMCSARGSLALRSRRRRRGHARLALGCTSIHQSASLDMLRDFALFVRTSRAPIQPSSALVIGDTSLLGSEIYRRHEADITFSRDLLSWAGPGTTKINLHAFEIHHPASTPGWLLT